MPKGDKIKQYYANRTPEQKDRHRKNMSIAMKKKRANESPRQIASRQKKLEAYHASPEGKEFALFRSYRYTQYYAQMSPEDKKKHSERVTKNNLKRWAGYSQEERDRINKKGNKHKFFEEEVPRVVDYCGVTTEKELEALNV